VTCYLEYGPLTDFPTRATRKRFIETGGFRMSRGVQAFKQTDVTKAIRAARKAGLDVERYEIDRAGTITIVTTKVSSELETAST
jgi:hypothetical protein